MADLKAVIEAQNQKVLDRFKAQDMKGAASLYTEDCKFMPPGGDIVHGRDDIEKAYSGAWAGGVRAIELKTKEVEPMGSDVIYEWGTSTMQIEGGIVILEGKYVIIWKKVGGEWLIHINIYNSSEA